VAEIVAAFAAQRATKLWHVNAAVDAILTVPQSFLFFNGLSRSQPCERGIRREGDLIGEMVAIRASELWVSNLQPFDCERGEPFTPIPWHNDSKHGVRNKWGLYLDPEFIQVCRERASRVITRQLEARIPPA
jgi:hypothetical protein